MGKPLIDKEREAKLIADRKKKFENNGLADPEFAERLFRLIIEESLKPGTRVELRIEVLENLL
jgi:chorismate mutase